jgi:hypothetical protein
MNLRSVKDGRWYPPLAAGLVFAILVAVFLMLSERGVVLSVVTAAAAGGVVWWAEGLRRDRRMRGLDEREVGMS